MDPQICLELKGLSILVVEDDPLIALDIALSLEDAGAAVIGPCASVAQSFALVEQKTKNGVIHGAVLDVELRKENSVPIARLLTEMAIPFLFHSGINSAGATILQEFDAPILSKPSSSADLIAAIVARLARFPV